MIERFVFYFDAMSRLILSMLSTYSGVRSYVRSGVGSLVRSGVTSGTISSYLSLERPRFFFGDRGRCFGIEDLTFEYSSYYFFVLPVTDAYD